MNTLRILHIVNERVAAHTASTNVIVEEIMARGYDWRNLAGNSYIACIGIENVPEPYRAYVLARVRMPISAIPPEGILHHALQEQLARDMARLTTTVDKDLQAINDQLDKHQRRVEANLHVADRRGAK